MLRRYHENWKDEDWNTYVDKYEDDFKDKFGKPIASKQSFRGLYKTTDLNI